MSKTDEEFWEDAYDYPSLDTEEGRDKWMDLFKAVEGGPEGEWAKALVVQDNENMIIRLKMPNGTETVMDVVIRREYEMVSEQDVPDGTLVN